MPEDTLEQVRLLSNLESNRHKLLQIVLFGQPELDADARQDRRCASCATASRTASACGRSRWREVAKYLSFRMRAAGYRGPEVFTPRAVRQIARASGGLTRRINILADKALLAAYTENTHADHRPARARRGRRFGVRRAPRSPWRPLAYARPPRAVAGVAVRRRRCSGCDSPPLPMRSRPPRRRPGGRPGCRPRPAANRPAEPCRRREPEPEPPSRSPSRADRRAGTPPGRLLGRRRQRLLAERLAASAREARAAPTTSAMRSSSSSPTTAIRRAWSASCSAPATWCRWRNSMSSRSRGRPVPAVGGVRGLRQPRGGRCGRDGGCRRATRRPSAPRRAASASFARRVVKSSRKCLRDRRLRSFPQSTIVLSLPAGGVRAHEHGEDDGC